MKNEVISQTKIQCDYYFSNLFTRQKKDGSYRTVLNIKYLDEESYTQPFKMEYIRQAIYMIKPGIFLASLDIKDAFYSFPVHRAHQKFLKCLLKGKTLQFNAMPNGYIDTTQVFNNHHLNIKDSKGYPLFYMWMIHYWEVILLWNVGTMFSAPLHASRIWVSIYTHRSPLLLQHKIPYF